jgi:hypothetical protein
VAAPSLDEEHDTPANTDKTAPNQEARTKARAISRFSKVITG